MKRLLIFSLMLLLILSGCTTAIVSKDEPPQDNLAIDDNLFVGSFTTIDWATGDLQNYYSLHANQIDNNHIIIWSFYYDNSHDNMLWLYDLSSNQITQRLYLGNSRIIRVCNDKIIIGNQQEFYAVNFDLQIISDKTALPKPMFDGMNNYEYPDNWIQYTVSEDLQKIVYDNPITGLNYYNLTNNENHLLFNTKNTPYWYDEYYADPNLGPKCLNFLPGDEEIYFLCNASSPYEIWVINLASEQIWQTEAGSLSDFWYNVWEKQNNTIFPCFQENIGYGYGNIYVRQVDLLNKTEGEYKTLPDDLNVSPDTPAPVYNAEYLAYVIAEPNPLPGGDTHYDNPILNEYNERSRIIVVDFATMTPRTVLEFPYTCNLNLLSITEDGQVLFTWQENSDSVQFIVGLTAKIQ